MLTEDCGIPSAQGRDRKKGGGGGGRDCNRDCGSGDLRLSLLTSAELDQGKEQQTERGGRGHLRGDQDLEPVFEDLEDLPT